MKDKELKLEDVEAPHTIVVYFQQNKKRRRPRKGKCHA
jgi:hypothetical protein